MKVAVELGGGLAALKQGRRLRLAALTRACQILRTRYSIQHPFRDAKLERVGATLLVNVEGVHFEPASGQVVMKEVAKAVQDYINSAPLAGGVGERVAVRRHLLKEQTALSRNRHIASSRQARTPLRERIRLDETANKRRTM